MVAIPATVWGAARHLAGLLRRTVDCPDRPGPASILAVEPGAFAVDVQCLSPEPAESRCLPRGVALQADSLAAWIPLGIGALGSSGPGAGLPRISTPVGYDGSRELAA